MECSKKKLTIFWICGGFLFSVLGIVPSVIYWSYANPEWRLEVIGEIIGSSIMLPVGWLFCAIIPMSFPLSAMSWVSIAAFVWACKVRKIKPLYLAYAACTVFGLFWPKTFWAMMSV